MSLGNLLLMTVFLCAPQEDTKTLEGISQIEIDKTIEKGILYLKGAGSPGHSHSGATHSDELKLFTFIHAGVGPSDAAYQKLLRQVLADELATTYKVSLQAMALEEIDRVRHQHRIAMCAQFLADNQCVNGQWTYGKPTPHAGKIAPPRASESARVLRSPKTDAGRDKPRVVSRIRIRKKLNGPSTGDNSNSQYAALGLRACHDAGIVFDASLITHAADWWRRSQNADRGWNYKDRDPDKAAYLSMTAGAVGSLVIYDHLLKQDWKRDPTVLAGIHWIISNFSATENSGRLNASDWYYYGMYALERAGILLGTEKFGPHTWYAEGAKALLVRQAANGSWNSGKQATSKAVWDTCFAILFLKRATRPMVASGTGS